MTEHEDNGDRLRDAWRGDTSQFADGKHCPTDQRILEAVREVLPVAERKQIILHTARCGACAQSWRIALELKRAQDSIAKPVAGRHWRRPPPAAWPLAAAAAVTLALGIYWMLPQFDPGVHRPDDGTILRGAEQQSLDLLVPNRTRMPINDIRLSWRAVEDASDYVIHVIDAQLRVRYTDTTRSTDFKLSPQRVEDLSPGDELYWFVSAHLADGRELRSSTRTIMLTEPDRNDD